MNILYVFGHDLVLGGHFKSAQAFISQLVKKGHSIHVMVPGGNDETIQPFIKAGATFSRLNKKYLINNGSKINKIQRFLKPNLEIIDAVKKYNIDIIHAQDPPIMVVAYLVACILNKAFIVTQAGGSFHNIRPPLKTNFVVYSKELIEGYKKTSWGNKLKIHLISERINTNIYKPQKIDRYIITKYHLPEDGIKIFFAMRLHKQKIPWLNSLLKFVTNLKITTKAHIIIAGDGDQLSDLKNRANKIIKETSYHFHFIGGIYNDYELAQIINYADISIGNGRGLMEAMACGKPVIILGENGEYEFIRENNIELISRYNFSGRHFKFINNIKINQDINNIDNSRMIYELGNFSYQYARNRLSSYVGTEKLIKVYKDSFNESNKKSDYYKWIYKREKDKLKI